MPLNADQFREFWEALRKAYKHPSLTIMMKVRLGKRLDEITLADDFQKIVFDVISDAEMQGYTLQLLNAARQSNPNNPELLAFAEQFGLASVTPTLEREVTRGFPFVDITRWRTRLGEIEGCVCRVEIPKTGREGEGTGFLVGPDLVLTNYHVMEPVIKGTYTPQDVVLRFDYRKAADGTELHAGTTFELVELPEKWLVDAAPYSPVDLKIDPAGELPAADQLDYALLRVADNPGKKPVNPKSADPTAPGRGWLPVPAAALTFTADAPLFIVQHPSARPLKLALHTKAVLGLNANQTRVRYRTNTEHGSSGSPCFDLDWNLIALHHGGDPDYDIAHTPQWNQGIPFDAIYRQLKARGFSGLLNQQP